MNLFLWTNVLCFIIIDDVGEIEKDLPQIGRFI